jgi:hypothetical protein
MKGKHRFKFLDEALAFVKENDNERVHGYKIMHDKDEWYVEARIWTPYGMKYKWVEA